MAQPVLTPRRLPCVHGYNASADGMRYTFLRPGELLQPHTQCPFMLNSGLLVLRPFSGAAFERDVVQPMRSHAINTYVAATKASSIRSFTESDGSGATAGLCSTRAST